MLKKIVAVCVLTFGAVAVGSPAHADVYVTGNTVNVGLVNVIVHDVLQHFKIEDVL